MSRMVRRFLTLVLLAVLVAAGITRALEGVGVYECGCYPECWCKRPGLSLFRWVVRRYHVGPWNPEDKARHEDSVQI